MALLTSCFCFDIIAIIVTLLIGGITYMKWRLTYWEKKGLPTLPSSIPFGNAKDIIFGRLSFGEKFREFYRAYKDQGHRHGGFYLGVGAIYVPCDPELVKHIMQIDFAHFNGHGGYVDEEIDPLTGHLFNLSDAKWRNLRVKLTPTFTSGKMKMMFHTMISLSENLKELVDHTIEESETVDIKDALGRFGVDVISSVAFGLECNSLKDPNVPFRVYGQKAVTLDFWDNVKIFKQTMLPAWVLRAIRHKFTKTDVETFFMKTIRDVVEYREKNNVYRKDFMHLLLQLKNRGTVTDDEIIIDETGESKEVGLTLNQLAAQAYVFFMAGFETSSNSVSFALYELAVNPETQDKLREEVLSVLDKHDGQITYDAIMEMTYMDKVLNETLRKYPPLPIIMRLCNKDYTIPKTDIVIQKGDAVMIPILGIQTDPEFYPNPEVFDPERFSEENKQQRPAFTWFPFGDGPRICIGMRFAILQSKIALTVFLKNYVIKLNEKTSTPIKFDKRAFVTKPDGVILLNLTKLK